MDTASVLSEVTLQLAVSLARFRLLASNRLTGSAGPRVVGSGKGAEYCDGLELLTAARIAG